MGLVQNIAVRYLARTAAIKLEETPTELIVSGSYQEMKDIISKLKSRGFYYNSSDRTWRIPLSKMTPRKRQGLENLLAGRLDTMESKALREQESKARAAEVEAAFKGLMAHKFPGFGIYHKGVVYLVRGMTYPITRELKQLGGSWAASEGAFMFEPGKMDLADVPKLEALLEARGKINQRRFDEVEKVVGSGRSWPTLGITLSYSKNEGFTIKGDTRPYQTVIRSIFDHPTWTGMYWSIKAMGEGPEPFEKLIARLDEGEKEAIVEKAKEVAKAPEKACRPNRKPGDCARCGWPVRVGDGCIYLDYDDMDDREVWRVVHKDKAVCEANIAQAKEIARKHQEKVLRKGEALKKLQAWVKAHDQTPSGTDHKLPGERIYLRGRNSVIYGGGEWVQIEPGDRHFWYVVNNGADGDDWSRNNVLTGGAGAVGHRAPLTPEVRSWIDAASEGEN